ncbi:MAG: hypothetical protein AAFV45_00660 [Pseudomonadota bacterium]
MLRRTSTCFAIFVSALFLIGTPRAAFAEDETYGLPAGEGLDDVVAYCSACHSLGLVVQQGLTRSQWADLVVWMYDEQGMSELSPEEEERVLDYLAANVGPEQQKQRLRDRGILR